jgi:hypothetical protein
LAQAAQRCFVNLALLCDLGDRFVLIHYHVTGISAFSLYLHILKLSCKISKPLGASVSIANRLRYEILLTLLSMYLAYDQCY